MSIIETTHLSAQLPSDADSTAITNAVAQASDLTNAWALNYLTFPDSSGERQAPGSIVRYCLQIAKLLYYQAVGRVSRDGDEGPSIDKQLDTIKKTLLDIDIAPSILTKTIAVNATTGAMQIARAQHILRWHPLCKVDSGVIPANQWVQGYHWDIRQGWYLNSEDPNAWYFDASPYKGTIEGTLSYARSWRKDYRDYQRFYRKTVPSLFNFLRGIDMVGLDKGD